MRAVLTEQMTMVRHALARALAARLGRSEDAIREHGLNAGDFRCDARVHVTFGDGSTMTFRHAFAVSDDEHRLAGIFTEHCGYYCCSTVETEILELRGPASSLAE